MRHILFLDCDGVVRSSQSKKYWTSKNQTNKNFCPICCSNLQHIINIIPTLEIVVSSNWAINQDINSIKSIFEEHKMPLSIINKIIGITPLLKCGDRGDEIIAWMLKHDYQDSFVIIDDLDQTGDILRDNLVQTNPQHGFMLEDAYKACKILLGE